MYTLYYSPGSCSMASHILLEECGAPYETTLVSLPKREQRTDKYRAINPHGKVPALAVDGTIITQNTAILPFIANQFPDANMRPADPVAMAECVAQVGYLASVTHVAFSQALHPERPAGGADIGETAMTAISTAAQKTYWSCMEEIDRRLSDRPWMMGAQYTFLDPYTLVYYGWGNRLKMPMSDLEHFTAFKNRMKERPAVRTILEKEQSPLLKAA